MTPAIEEIVPQLVVGTESEPRLDTQDILGLVTEIVPNLTRDRTFGVEIDEGQGQKIALTAQINHDGSVLYTSDTGERAFVQADGGLNRKISNLKIPPHASFGAIKWILESQTVESVDWQSDRLSDETVAGMINRYYGTMDRLFHVFPQEDIFMLQARADAYMFLGHTNVGLDFVVVTKAAQKIIQVPGVYAAMVAGYDDPQMQTPGQVIFYTSNPRIKNGKFIFDLMLDEKKQGSYGFVGTQGTVETLAEAIQNGNYFDLEGQVYQAGKTNISGDDFIVLTRQGAKGGVFSKTPKDLKDKGYTAATPPVGKAYFGDIQKGLKKFEQKTTRTDLSQLLARHLPDFLGDDAKILESRIAVLPPIVPTAPFEQRVIKVEGLQYDQVRTPAGGPAGSQLASLYLNIDGHPVKLSEVPGNGVSGLGIVGDGELTQQQIENARLLQFNPDWIKGHPTLGAIFSLESVRTAGEAVQVPRIYFRHIPPNAGFEAIFPEQALIIQDPRVQAVRSDLLMVRGDNNFELKNTQFTSNMTPNELLIVRAIQTNGAILIGLYPQEVHETLLTTEFEKLKSLLEIHPIGTAVYGMVQEDFEAFARALNIFREKVQMTYGNNWLIKGATRTQNLFGDKPSVTSKDLLAQLRSMMKIFDKNAASHFPKRPLGGLALADIEQRTLPEQFATEITDFHVTIADNLRIRATKDQFAVASHPDSIISLRNVARLIGSKELKLAPTEVFHTAILKTNVTIGGKILQAGDVVFSNVDGQNNQIIDEKIIRTRTVTNQMEYFELINGQERELAYFNKADIELELMHRYIKGEIDFKSVQQPGKPQYQVVAIPGKQPTPKDLTFDQLVIARGQAESAAQREFVRRSLDHSAYKIVEHFRSHIDSHLLGNQLQTKYYEFVRDGEPKILRQAGEITSIRLDQNGKVIIGLAFEDFIGDHPPLERTIHLDLNKNTIVYGHFPRGILGQTQKFQFEQHPLMKHFAAGLFENAQLHLDPITQEALYADLNDKDGNFWIHNYDGTQIAMRESNIVRIYDFDDPTKVMEVPYDLYLFGADETTSRVNVREATIAERRFFARKDRNQTVIRQPKPKEMSMLYAYEDGVKGKMRERMAELRSKEQAMRDDLANAESISRMTEIGIFPQTGMYEQLNVRDIVLSLVATMAVDNTHHVHTRITSGDILRDPDSLKTGTLKIETGVSIIQNLRGSTYRGDSSIRLIIDVTDVVSDDTYVIIAPLTKNIRFDAIHVNEIPEIGIAYGLTYNAQTKKAQLVRIEVPYKYDVNRKVFVQSDDPIEFKDILGTQGHWSHQEYRGCVKELIETDSIGKFITTIDKGRDWEKKILLAEMLGVDTNNVWRNSSPQIIEHLYKIFMEPFPADHVHTLKHPNPLPTLTID